MKYLPIFALLIIVLDFALLTVAEEPISIRMRNICAEKNSFLPKKESPNERCQSACKEFKCRKGVCFKVPGTDAKTCKCSFCFEWNNPKDKKNRRDKGIFGSLRDKITSLPG